MTPNEHKITFTVEADQAVKALREVSDRIEAARFGRPPSRWDWAWWIAALVGCLILFATAVIDRNGLAAAGWVVAGWHASGIGPKGTR